MTGPSTGFYHARDPLGVKPLYWSRFGGHLYVASEIKALVPVGGPVTEIPPGHYGWGSPIEDPGITAYVDLLTMGDGDEPITDVGQAAQLVRAALEDSIRVRVDTDLTVGVILSGGLDSTLTLLHVREMHPKCVAFTIGTPGSDDVSYARRVTRGSALTTRSSSWPPAIFTAQTYARPSGYRNSPSTATSSTLSSPGCSSPGSTVAVSKSFSAVRF